MARAKSLPSRERGLKFPIHYQMLLNDAVAPLAGAWIEITFCNPRIAAIVVAPLAGAWIEIRSIARSGGTPCSRSPRGSVD